MALLIENQTIDRVLVIDDDQSARDGYKYTIEDLGLKAILESGPINDLDAFVKTFSQKADAVLCDYHLRKHNYANFNGDKLVAACYRNRVPSILCTTYTDVNATLNRGYLRFIPAFLRTSSPDPEAVRASFAKCIREFTGDFPSSRKPWRTLIRVEEIDSDRVYLYVVIPGWNTQKKIRLYLDNFPKVIREVIQEDMRLHAQVNIGAETYEDLYFDEWEID